MLDGVDWIVGDAEKRAAEEPVGRCLTIAFGMRNVTRIDAALAEARRVLRPGGRFLCLEFSRVVVPVLRDIYDRYSFTVVPRLGRMVAGDREATSYLVESIRQFPDQESLVRRIEAAGLRAGALPQPVRRGRGDPFRLAALIPFPEPVQKSR